MECVKYGIDLGTTNSLIAKYENNKVTIFKNPIGHKETLASVIAYRPDRILIGDKAREYLTKDSVNVFGGFKRKMGTDEKFYVVNIDENVTPIELSSLILKELKKFIPNTEKLEAAVITIPASFDSMQSNATILAGEKAGIKNTFLLQEPIAASLAFFNAGDETENKDGYWLVYDFGGGTFDIALVKSSQEELKVVDHEGNNFLGGMDLDFAIIEEIILPHIVEKTQIENFEEEFRTKYGKYESLYYQTLYYAEEAKKELSQADNTSIEFSSKINDIEYDFLIDISKEDLNRIFKPKINETIKLLFKTLEQNNLTTENINEIILVGGSTFLPQVREELSNQTNIKINYSIDPTSAVAIGAAFYANNKYYKPTEEIVETKTLNEEQNEIVDKILNDIENENIGLKINFSYNKSSRDLEEILLFFCEGDYEEKFYRINREDGGFDTGLINLKAKKTEFLPLIGNTLNSFVFKVFDADHNEITTLEERISILQGKYNIEGQPLPNDICIEIDDPENNTTKLEAIFERNTLLPQKRTLYREIVKTIKKGSDDKLTINILEGDKNARPSSNLSIGCIEISGKDLKLDIIKGSDIEIEILLSESRQLSTTIFVVMSQQEFKNVFSISEKQVNIERLKSQFIDLENELTNSIKEFQYNEEFLLEQIATSFLNELEEIREKLFKLKSKDKTDEKYIIAEKVKRISQESDKLGGNERIAAMIEHYLHLKELVLENIKMVDFEKDEIKKEFQKLEGSEAALMKSKNISSINNKIEQLNHLNWKALTNNIGYLITLFNDLKSSDSIYFKDYNGAKRIMEFAEKALEKEQYSEFRKYVYNISHLLKDSLVKQKSEFNGTGIG